MAEHIRLRATNLGAKVGSQRAMYSVHYEDGTLLLERCKDPLTDGARAILAKKKRWPEGQMLELIDGRGTALVRATLKWAATHTIAESSRAGPKFSAYVPFDKKTYTEE